MSRQDDQFRAFMPYPTADVPHAATGPLAGLRLAVKDVIDVAGYRTGGGCPLMLAESDVKARTAPAVQRLLDAGARFVGKTHTDELAWSLYGVNPHFGTPVNPAAPDRVPGGSSSGSAVAVAANLADIAVGTDTGGSVRLPASFCGVWGFRPTHGRVSLAGCMALAAGFDTVGLFARDPETLQAAGAVLLDADQAPLPDRPRLLLAADMAERLGAAPREVFDRAVAHLSPAPVSVYGAAGADVVYTTFLTLQAYDTRASVIPWMIAANLPRPPGLDQRYGYAMSLTEDDKSVGDRARADFRKSIDGILRKDGVILAPAVHDVAFRLDAPGEVFDRYRHDAMTLLCVAGLAGLPQVVLPAGMVEGAPFGVSLIGPRGSDLSLMACARALFAGQAGAPA